MLPGVVRICHKVGLHQPADVRGSQEQQWLSASYVDGAPCDTDGEHIAGACGSKMLV